MFSRNLHCIVAQIRILTDGRSCSDFPRQPSNVPYREHRVTHCTAWPCPCVLPSGTFHSPWLPWHRPLSWAGGPAGGPCLGSSQASSWSDSGTQPSVLCSGCQSPTLMLALTPCEVSGWRVRWGASREMWSDRLHAARSSRHPGPIVHWRVSAEVVTVAISPEVTCFCSVTRWRSAVGTGAWEASSQQRGAERGAGRGRLL